MAARVNPRTVGAIAEDVKGSADMLEAAAHGIALHVQGLSSEPFSNRDHCLLSVYYDRIDQEAKLLRDLAVELRKGAGLDGGGR